MFGFGCFVGFRALVGFCGCLVGFLGRLTLYGGF